jgi:tetratricopeptide (TPR) repeat protein
MDKREELQEKLSKAKTLLKADDIDNLKPLLEDVLSTYVRPSDYTTAPIVEFMLGAMLIDLGNELFINGDLIESKEFVRKGIEILEFVEENFPSDENLLFLLYNIGNGYSALLKMEKIQWFFDGRISGNHRKQKEYYCRAVEESQKDPFKKVPSIWLCELYTNLGNCLDTVGRNVEALDYYEVALNINPNFAPALGNKGVTLSNIAFSIHGYNHVCLLEAKELLEKATSSQYLYQTMRRGFTNKLNQINAIIDSHKPGFSPEKIDNNQEKNAFHVFLHNFSNKHNLYLSPTIGVVTKGRQVHKDILYPSSLSGDIDTKHIEKCISFINQIKLDYAFSRYLLAQSQYPNKTIEDIDKDVDFYNPFDYSVFSSFVEMMQVSFRLSIDILDKVAAFTHFYYGLTKPKLSQTYFSNVWHQQNQNDQLQEILREPQNLFLLGLFDLSKDINEGYVPGFGFYKKRRNALTHRFLSVYEFLDKNNNQNEDCVSLDVFLMECIKALQISRAAIFYTVQMVEEEEKVKVRNGKFVEHPLEKYQTFIE